MLGRSELVDETSGENVDQLELGVADDEAPGCAHRNRHLHSEPHGGRRGRDHLTDPFHRLLHRQCAGRRARPVVAVEPARDRVAAEGDDVAAHAVELVDDRVEDEIQARGQLLGAALWPELLGQRLGQLREPGDVGEQGGAANAVGQLDALERAPAAGRGRCRPPGCRTPIRGWSSKRPRSERRSSISWAAGRRLCLSDCDSLGAPGYNGDLGEGTPSRRVV